MKHTGFSNRRLGVHTSIAGGIELSLERAHELGCNTMQIFSHSPRMWQAKQIPEASVLSFKRLRASYDIAPVFIHTSYLINLAAANSELLEKSISLLIQEMDVADMLGADYVVLHTGSASADTGDVGRRRAVDALRQVAATKSWKAGILLENTAGEKGDITSTMQDLSEIISATDSPLIAGVCIDTCHAFQAGYDLSKAAGVSGFSAEIKKYIGLEKVKLIHLNDSKKELGSRVDRHEHIGMGKIGQEGLSDFVNQAAFKDIPLVLETPKKDDEDDARNLKIVRGFFRPAAIHR